MKPHLFFSCFSHTSQILHVVNKFGSDHVITYHLVMYLDDSSRCIMTARLFAHATSDNAVLALRDAIKQFKVPATILLDNDSCFVGVGGRRKSIPKSWIPTAFEAELLDGIIELINSRPYHPQTNDKLESFHLSIEEELWHYGSLSEYIQYNNERRLHFSLDMKNRQTPLRVFSDRGNQRDQEKQPQMDGGRCR